MPPYRIHLAGRFLGATDEQQVEFRRLTGERGFKKEGGAYGEDGGRVLPAVIDLDAPGPIEACDAAEKVYRKCADATGLELDPFARLDRRAEVIDPGVSL